MSVFDHYDGDEEQLSVERTEKIEYSYTDPQVVEEHLTEAPSSLRQKVHRQYVILIMTVLVLRLAVVQIAQGASNANLAKEHSIRQIIVPAARGAIIDKRGVSLARNVPSFSVIVSPNDLPRLQKDRENLYDTLAVELKWSPDDRKTFVDQIETKLKHFQLESVVLKSNIPHDDALLFTEKLDALPAVSVQAGQNRQYNLDLVPRVTFDPANKPSTGMSHVLGYVGQSTPEDVAGGNYRPNELIGKSGVELTYDADLRGKDGVKQAEVNSKGKVLQILSDQTKDAVSGNTVVLNVDNKLQSIMAGALADGLAKAGLKSGVAVAMDPRSGAVRGMVSFPAYDSNQFGGGIASDVYNNLNNDPLKPLFNRATLGTFPSGSTIKPFMAAIGLQDGVITENTHIDTPAEIQIGQQVFPNWQHFFIPNVDVKQAIAKSNDIFFYAVGGGFDKIKGLGINRIDDGLPKFGFGTKTGIDLPSESAARVPTPDWKKQLTKQPWYIGDTYHLSIGQGDFLATPLQLALALSAVANNGTLYTPHVVDRIVDQAGTTVQTIAPHVVRDHFIDDNNLRIVREGMRQAVTDGSARQLQSLPVSSAGKTGTAQVGANNEFLHSWFMAFAPYDNPEIALVVLGEKGPQQNEGNTTAEPIAKTILEQYFSPDFQK